MIGTPLRNAVSDPKRRFAAGRISEIKVSFFFNKPLNKIERKKLERAARTCPVSGSLHKDLKETIVFIYN